MKILWTEKLTIGYEKALQSDVTIALKSGEITCLLGENGTGKSTFLKTLFGQLKPLEGKILLENQEVQYIPIQEMAKKMALVVTENLHNVFLTVQEVVELGRYPYLNFFGKLSSKDKKIVQQALKNAEIEHLKHRFFHQLSDGEKQKVMIAKALAQETSIILLDEPFAFLDYPSKLKIFALLRKIAITQQKAILIVLHELELAIQMADSLWLLAHHYPLLVGNPEDLILKGQFSTYFQQENVCFNINTGKFDFVQEHLKSIELVGKDDKIAFWLQNALLKKGYKIGKNALCQIHFSENNYQLFWNTQQITVNSIENLMNEIQKYEKN